MDAISFKGEILVSIITILVVIVYSVRNCKKSKDQYIKYFFFLIWICFFGKTVRSNLLNLIGNTIISLCIACLLVHTLRKRKVRSDNDIVIFLLSCFFIYSLITFVWLDSKNDILIWAVSFMTFVMMAQLVRTYSHRELISLAFSSFRYIAIYNIIIFIGFTFTFPNDALINGIQLCGPFGTNYVARNLLSVIFGLVCLYERDGRRTDQILLWICLCLILLTLSRSGILIASTFYVPTCKYFMTKRAMFILFLLTVVILLTCFLISKPDLDISKLHTRFIGDADSGRIGIISTMWELIKEDIWFGRGFNMASRDYFLESTNPARDRGFSSHCFYLSVLYEYGIIGAGFFLALIVIVLLRLRDWAKYDHIPKYIYWLVISYCVSALFENTHFLGVMPYSFLVLFCFLFTVYKKEWIIKVFTRVRITCC